MEQDAQKDIQEKGEEIVGASPQREPAAQQGSLGEEADVEQIDLQTVLPHQPQSPAQPSQGQVFKAGAARQAHGDGGEQKQMAHGEVGDLQPGQGRGQVAQAGRQPQGPEQQITPAQPAVLPHIEPHQQSQKKDGEAVKDVQVVPVLVLDQHVAHSHRRGAGPCRPQHPVPGAAQPAETPGGEDIEEQDAGHIPVEGPRGMDPVGEEGGVPHQGGEGGLSPKNEEEGVGNHHHKIGGEDAPGPAHQKGTVFLLPAAQGEGQPHGGEQDEDVHPAEARRPKQVQPGDGEGQISGMEQHHPEHGGPHQLRAIFA